MSEISSIGQGQGPGPVQRNHVHAAHSRNGVAGHEEKTAATGDRVELSDHARLIDKLHDLPEVRTGLVEQARKAIDDPQYLSEQRLNVAIDRLLEDIHAEDSGLY